MPEKIDLGEVTSMIAKTDPNEAEYLNLIVTDDSGDTKTIRASREAMNGLLSHLTSILYPRAAPLIASDSTTVKRFKGEMPPDVSYMSVALQSEQDPQVILITCTSRERLWMVRLTHETADDLWASLEDKFNHM